MRSDGQWREQISTRPKTCQKTKIFESIQNWMVNIFFTHQRKDNSVSASDHPNGRSNLIEIENMSENFSLHNVPHSLDVAFKILVLNY
jgi:hypothetical protein